MVLNNTNDEYYDLGNWISKKFNYHKKSKNFDVKRLRVNYGEVWYCDLGFNIWTEKNKVRPVLVVSNNKINNSEKIVIVSITDTKGKLNKNDLPAQDSWYLLYSNTTDNTKKIKPNRIIPKNSVSYSFLDKDSVIQCEEIRAVSKSRLDSVRGAIGVLDPNDLKNIKTQLELKCSLSNRREFRIYYFLNNEKMVCFNSLMKDTQTTPEAVKDTSVRLIKEYLQNWNLHFTYLLLYSTMLQY